MKTKKLLVGLGGMVMTLGVGYILYNLLKRQPRNIASAIEDTKQSIRSAPKELQGVLTGKYPPCGFPLKKGCGGDKIKKLQKFLNREGGYDLEVDGKFGNLTENAVIDNQMPFTAFKAMHPYAVKGQVQEEFYNLFISKIA